VVAPREQLAQNPVYRAGVGAGRSGTLLETVQFNQHIQRQTEMVGAGPVEDGGILEEDVRVDDEMPAHPGKRFPGREPWAPGGGVAESFG
jgi:hypothetical protein